MSRNEVAQAYFDSCKEDILNILFKNNCDELEVYLDERSKEDPDFLKEILNTNVTCEKKIDKANTVTFELSIPQYCLEISRSICENHPDLDPLAILIDQKQKIGLLFYYGSSIEHAQELHNKYIDAIYYEIDRDPEYVEDMLANYDPETFNEFVEQGIFKARNLPSRDRYFQVIHDGEDMPDEYDLEIPDDLLGKDAFRVIPRTDHPLKTDSGYTSPETAIVPPSSGKLSVSENTAFKKLRDPNQDTVFL